MSIKIYTRIRHLKESKTPGFMRFLQENIDYPAMSGRHVLSGARQSIPSSNIDSCAGVNVTFPVVAEGYTNRPFSKRLENRHAP